MIKADDCHPFPIQGETVNGTVYPACTVPGWLAKLAHVEYVRQHTQSFNRIAERGGFGRAELIALIRGNYIGGIRKAQEDLGAAKASEPAQPTRQDVIDGIEDIAAKAEATKKDLRLKAPY